jgi:hypothetical protein
MYNVIDRRGSEFDYEVRYLSMTGNGEETFAVNLLRRECSCRKWLITGLPCCHVIACMKSQSIDIDQYVPDCFRKEKYEACYRSIIYPTNGQALWRRTEYADLQPPPVKRQPGRPKKKRRKDADEKRDEQQLKRAKNGVKCSRCKKEGHNKSTCNLPPPPTPATATDGNTSANASASATANASASAQSTATGTNATLTVSASAQSAATGTNATLTVSASATAATATASASVQSTATGTANATGGNGSTHSMRSGTTSKPSQKSKKDKAPKRASLSQPTTKKKKTPLEKKKGSTSTQP